MDGPARSCLGQRYHLSGKHAICTRVVGLMPTFSGPQKDFFFNRGPTTEHIALWSGAAKDVGVRKSMSNLTNWIVLYVVALYLVAMHHRCLVCFQFIATQTVAAIAVCVTFDL